MAAILSNSLWNAGSHGAVADLAVSLVLLRSAQDQSVSVSGLRFDGFSGSAEVALGELAQVLVVADGAAG